VRCGADPRARGVPIAKGGGKGLGDSHTGPLIPREPGWDRRQGKYVDFWHCFPFQDAPPVPTIGRGSTKRESRNVSMGIKPPEVKLAPEIWLPVQQPARTDDAPIPTRGSSDKFPSCELAPAVSFGQAPHAVGSFGPNSFSSRTLEPTKLHVFSARRWSEVGVRLRKRCGDGLSRGGSRHSNRRVATLAIVGLLAVPASAALLLASGQDSAGAAGSARPAPGASHYAVATQLLRPADVPIFTNYPNPPANLTDQPAWKSCTHSGGVDNSPGCTNAMLAYINSGRANDGVKPMVLPGNYLLLTPAQQLLVIINLERGDRGMTVIPGLCTSCDAAAQQGIVLGGDPAIDGFAFGSIWAGGTLNVLEADFGWMYDDGWGGSRAATPNGDCTGPGASGCWGHREMILGNPDYFSPGSTFYAGAAEGTFSAAPGWPTYAAILVAFPPGEVPPLDWTEPALDLPVRTFVSIASTPDGLGYWLAASDGTVVARGDAGSYGSMSGQRLNRPIAHIVATSDGGVFSFDAPFHGSMGGQQLDAPIVGMAGDEKTGGYWMVGADGGVFTFDAPFLGSR